MPGPWCASATRASGTCPQSGVVPAGRTLRGEAETAFADDHALVEESRAIEERLARAGAEDDATAGLLAGTPRSPSASNHPATSGAPSRSSGC